MLLYLEHSCGNGHALVCGFDAMLRQKFTDAAVVATILAGVIKGESASCIVCLQRPGLN